MLELSHEFANAMKLQELHRIPSNLRGGDDRLPRSGGVSAVDKKTIFRLACECWHLL